jgi:hypothetical protein
MHSRIEQRRVDDAHHHFQRLQGFAAGSIEPVHSPPTLPDDQIQAAILECRLHRVACREQFLGGDARGVVQPDCQRDPRLGADVHTIAMAARTAVTTCLAIAFIFCDESVSLPLLDPTTLSISTKCREDATFLFMLSNARCRV